MNTLAVNMNSKGVIPQIENRKTQNIQSSLNTVKLFDSGLQEVSFKGNCPKVLKNILTGFFEAKKIRKYMETLSSTDRKVFKELLNEAKKMNMKVISNDTYYTLSARVKFEKDLKPEAKKLGISVLDNDDYYTLLNKISFEKDLIPQAKKLGVNVVKEDNYYSLNKKIKFETELKPEAKKSGIEINPEDNYDTLSERIEHKKLKDKAAELGLSINKDDDFKTLKEKVESQIKFNENAEAEKARLKREQELKEYEEELAIKASLSYYN